jgi:hypothetical protein
MVATRRRVGAHRWELALVAVTAVWGSTFVLVRDAVALVALDELVETFFPALDAIGGRVVDLE